MACKRLRHIFEIIGGGKGGGGCSRGMQKL